MLTETLVALAASGATTLVGAMATDGWTAARQGFGRLFARKGKDEQARLEAQLDSNAERVAAGDPDRARTALAGSWQLELEGFIEAHPEAAEELQALVAEIQDGLPDAARAWVQTNIARDNATVFAAQGGNVIIQGRPDDVGW
ncbi:hypothetical protein [Nonomuraea sp. NPDC049158]|uniref:hypothetical protein n=1 Tax=Nonomuraea sp. NPDC049158 TaxID=3155649 RepID=UPI003401E2F4